ncbi:MAG: efflux RND transporter permease subunit [Saprospiraceae bacterium]
MRLPKLAVANYQFVIVLVLMMLALGTLSFLSMPRSEDPALEFPRFTVIAIYPGTSPEDMEELVVNKIEDELDELEDIEEFSSRISDGVAIIAVEADFSVNIDDKYDEVVNKVNNVRDELPADLLSLEVEKFSVLDVSILQLAIISASASYTDLEYWGEQLEKKLKQVSGVRTVDLHAYPSAEVQVQLDLEKMANLSLSLNQVMQMMQSNNANIPGGDVRAGGQIFALKTSGGYADLEEIKNTVISFANGSIIRLRDIANVQYGYEDEKHVARFNQERSIYLTLTQKAGRNILEVNTAIEAAIADFKNILPQNMRIETAFEQAPAVEARISDFFNNLLQGIGLVGLIILLFLGLRNSLIIMTVIPTSIVVAIFLMDKTGFGLHQISIAGLVIALGLLVDNGIVVVENINRFLQQGYSRLDAAVKGTAEVGYAIISSTATTVLAFVPMLFLGGGTGQFLESLPTIVIYSLLASLLLALIFTPMLASRLLPKKARVKPTLAERSMQWIVKKMYRPALNFSLRYPLIIIGLAILSLVGSGYLFPLVGISFFPNADKPLLIIDIDLPDGANLKKTDKVAQFVESVLAEEDLIANFTTNVGKGNEQVYYNKIPKNFNQGHAQVIVNLDTFNTATFYPLMDRLAAKFTDYPGAKIKVNELKNGPPAPAPIAIRAIGEEIDELRRITSELETIFKATEGTTNVDNPLATDRTNIQVNINKDKAGMLGLPISDVDLAVRTAITGTNVGTFNDAAGKEYDMVVRLPVQQERGLADFSKIYVSSVTGGQVPLAQVAKLEFASDIKQINHFDTERSFTVTADVTSDYNVRNVTEEIISKMEAIDMPAGYRFYIDGEYENQQESFGDLGTLLIVAVLGIFAVLILQFRSFMQPFIVVSAIPLAFTGSISALYLTGWTFSFFAFVGFTSLVGIVVNTSIILVDYANQLLAEAEQKRTVKEALIQACETRFTPIILTTLTTILGLLPLTLTNSGLWSPLGWTIIGGMVSSTFLTLLIVPILYEWMTKEVG